MRRVAVLGALLIAAGVGAVFFVRPPAASESEVQSPPVASTSPEEAAHDHAEPTGGRRGPNGRPIPEDTPVRSAGWTQAPHRHALDDAQAWVGERAEAHERWLESTATALDIYADREQLGQEQFARVYEEVARMQATVGETRRRIEAGELTPADGRRAIYEAREACTEALNEVLGAQATEDFRLEMIKRVPGGLL
jgi:hypothetical protein